jgi:hypothetical protein
MLLGQAGWVSEAQRLEARHRMHAEHDHLL